MKLTPPFPLTAIVQRFGDNAVNYGDITQTLGHPGIDFAPTPNTWGTPIPSTIDAPIGAILSKDNPDLMQFRAINQIYDDTDGKSYEIQSGHCSDMDCVVGQNYVSGSAKIGNTGAVFANGKLVTADEKMLPNHPGAHLHYQVRLLQKESVELPMDPNKHYINDGTGMLVLNGFRYYTVNYNNGYHGCIDPMQFFAADDDLPSTKLLRLADSMQATNPSQVAIVRAVGNLLKAFGT